jgi:cold shock CspA family protein
MKGHIKFYNTEKSFGFIKCQGTKDIFFHKSALPKGVVAEENDEVEFELINTERGQAASEIRKI